MQTATGMVCHPLFVVVKADAEVTLFADVLFLFLGGLGRLS